MAMNETNAGGLPPDGLVGRRLLAADYAGTAPDLAPRFLGALLCRRREGRVMRVRITETEAYRGEDDSACHARSGRTPRNAVMYRRGGFAYVYLCYGIHWLLNIVTGPEDFPEAVLVRGVEGYPGPGRLTKALGIGRDENGADLAGSDGLWLEDDGFRPVCRALPRVGIGYATPEDQARLWRFVAG